MCVCCCQGYKILTGSYVGKDALQIWNYSTDYSTDRKNKPQVVEFPAGDKGPFLYAAQFCDNDVVVAGGSGTNSAMAINSETNQVGVDHENMGSYMKWHLILTFMKHM